MTDLFKKDQSGHGIVKRYLRYLRQQCPRNLSYGYQNLISLLKCILTPLIKRLAGRWSRKDTPLYAKEGNFMGPN